MERGDECYIARERHPLSPCEASDDQLDLALISWIDVGKGGVTKKDVSLNPSARFS